MSPISTEWLFPSHCIHHGRPSQVTDRVSSPSRVEQVRQGCQMRRFADTPADSDRQQLIFLTILHGITTAIFLTSLAIQKLSKHSGPSFWLARWDEYDQRKVLTINAFTIWLPLCSLYTGGQLGCIIWRLQNLEWVATVSHQAICSSDDISPYANQSNRLVLAVIPLIPLVCLGWMVSCS